jgi:predicted nucleotidyltransferase
VSTETVRSAWDVAGEVATSFAGLPEIDGVLLFGSVARQRSGPDSDIDMLVVGTDPALTSRVLVAGLPARLRRWRLAVQYYTQKDLSQLFEAGPAFTDHLRGEGVILYDRDGRLRELIRSPRRRSITIDDEIAMHLDRLHLLENWPQYNGNFLACLAQLYSIAKAIIILALLRLGSAEFDHRIIFTTYRERYPERSADVDTVAQLAPFSRLLAGNEGVELPFPYRDAEARARAVVAALRRLAAP